jgi:hypothetical protein
MLFGAEEAVGRVKLNFQTSVVVVALFVVVADLKLTKLPEPKELPLSKELTPI